MWHYKWKAVCFIVTFLQFASLNRANVTSQNVMIETFPALLHKEKLTVENRANANIKSFTDIDNASEQSGPAVSPDVVDSYGENSIGFAAEWEYIGVAYDDESPTYPFEAKNSSAKQQQNIQFPSRRIGPGTWYDSDGNWWLFGGQGPFARKATEDEGKQAHNSLSDLWLYSPEETFQDSASPSPSQSPSTPQEYSWKLVFRPETNSEAPYSSFPENLDFPLLCGSEKSKHIALYGSHKSNPRASSESHNSPFSEDNIVWLYDIPKALTQVKVLRAPSPVERHAGGDTKERKKSGCNWSSSSFSPESCNGTSEIHQQEEKQGLWTSYVCCDACLPDGNTTFEFCPQFSRDPISWCSKDSIMMLQLVIATPARDHQENKEVGGGGVAAAETSGSSMYATSTTTFTSGSFDKKKSGLYAMEGKNDDNGDIDEGGRKRREKLIQDTTATTTQKVASFADPNPNGGDGSSMATSQGSENHEIIRKNESIQSRMNLSPRSTGRGIDGNGVRNAAESSISPGSLDTASNEQGNVDFLIADEKSQKAVGQEEEEKRTSRKKMGESELTGSGENLNGTRKSEQMKRNGRDVIQDVASKEKKNIIASTLGIGQKSEKSGGSSKEGATTGSSSGSSLNWWKFDLVSTEWIKMPEVNIERELTDKVRNGDCRVVVSQRSQLVYILCPTNGNLLDRVVLLFDPKTASLHLLGTIHLNNAFSDKKVWQLGRSVLHALHCDNQTVIFLAYHKLLDLWIHDHSSNRLYPVENVWKGSSLHTFQKVNSFYKLSISIPSASSEEETYSKNVGSENPKHYHHHTQTTNDKEKKENGNVKKGMHTTHSFFMVNPRLKLANYDDSFPQAHFHITIVPDREVFLPPRDATYLISSTEFQSDDKFPMLNSPEKDKHSLKESNTASLTKQDLNKGSKHNISTTRGLGSSSAFSSISSSGIPKADQLKNLEASPKTASFVGKNELSLSQQTLPAKSNKPLYEAQEPVKKKSLSNLQSDEKLEREESPVHKVSALLSKHNKVSSTNSTGGDGTTHGGNGSSQQTKTPNLADASSSHVVVQFKSNNDNKGNTKDFMAYPPSSPTSTNNLRVESGLPSSLKSMEEHRQNKYRADIRSEKRVPFSKQSELLLGNRHGQNVTFTTSTLISKKRIFGIKKASVFFLPSTQAPTVIPSLAKKGKYDGNGNDEEEEEEEKGGESNKGLAFDSGLRETNPPGKIDSSHTFERKKGVHVPNETVVMTIDRSATTNYMSTSPVGNNKSDLVQISDMNGMPSSKGRTHFPGVAVNGQLRNEQENPIILKTDTNIHERRETTGSNRNGESTTPRNNNHFNDTATVAKSHDGSELAVHVSSHFGKSWFSSKGLGLGRMDKIMVKSKNEKNNNNESDITATTTPTLSSGRPAPSYSQAENTRLLLLKQKQLFPASRKTPVLASKLVLKGKERKSNFMNSSSSSSSSQVSGIMIKEPTSTGDILDSSSSVNGEPKMNLSKSYSPSSIFNKPTKTTTGGMDETVLNNAKNYTTTFTPTSRSKETNSVSASETPSFVDSATAVASSSPSPPAGLLPFTPIVLRFNSTLDKIASSEQDDDDDDHVLVSDVNFNQPQHQQERFRNGGESLNNGGSVHQTSTNNNAKEIDQVDRSASATASASALDLAKSTFSSWSEPNNLSRILQGNTSIAPKSSKTNITLLRGGKGLAPEYVESPKKRTTQSVREEQVDDDASSSTAAAVSNHHHEINRESSTAKIYPSTTSGGTVEITAETSQREKKIMRIQNDQSQTSHFTKSLENPSPAEDVRITNDRYTDALTSNSQSTNFHKDLSVESPQSIVQKQSLFYQDESSEKVVETSSSFSLITQNHNNDNNKHYREDDGGGGGAQGDIDSPLRPMTYGSSEIVVEPRDNVMPYGEEGTGDVGYSPTIFFAITLSFFASIGVVLFIRRCVKCPPRQESVLIKEPPPIRYSVIPDDLSFHTPIV